MVKKKGLQFLLHYYFFAKGKGRVGTWKKKSRAQKSNTEQVVLSSPVNAKCKKGLKRLREEAVEELEQGSKKTRGQNLWKMTHFSYQRVLSLNPIGHYEDLMVELLRVGNPQSANSLGFLLKQQVSNLVFLLQTRIYSREVLAFRGKQGLKFAIGVYCGDNQLRGLALRWSKNSTVSLQSFSKGHINVIVENFDILRRWRFNSFYDNSKTHIRKQSWDLLKLL